jgi:hypothetical protein
MRYVWERLHSQQILQAVYRRDWPLAWRLAQSASYWNQLPHPDQKPTERGEDLDRHARWAKGLVAEAAAQLDDGTAGVLPIGWRHPLTPVLNKEAYNIRAELQSALTGQTYEDACRIVMSITGNDGPGMLPDPEDRQLYVSMPTAIATARKTYPDFARTMVDQFEPLGRIRVQAALNRKDFASLQIATLQFMGTDASRQAHVVLGEVALSLGQFERDPGTTNAAGTRTRRELNRPTSGRLGGSDAGSPDRTEWNGPFYGRISRDAERPGQQIDDGIHTV